MYLLYTPSRYTGEDLYKSDIHIERIFPDEQFWLDQVSRVKDFFTKSILPELLGKFYSRKDEPKATSNTAQDPCCSVTSGDVTDGEGGSSEASKMKLYCYCQVPDGYDMVGCDNRACECEWFHLKCLKLKDFPSKNIGTAQTVENYHNLNIRGKKIECNNSLTLISLTIIITVIIYCFLFSSLCFVLFCSNFT